MQIVLDKSEIIPIVDEIMKERGYVPANDLKGKTIGIKEFAKKYCYPHGIAWVKLNIIYRFKPEWVAEIYPGKGRGFTIFEKPAAIWMEKHRKEIDWNA